jgi:hypothetical protein
VDKNQQNEKFKPIFANLLPTIIKSCDLTTFKGYDEEDIHEFRDLAADALMGVFYIVFGDYFGMCQQLLQQCIPNGTWSLVESILFAITSIAQVTGGKNLEKLFPILESFPKIKTDDYQLKTTMIDVLGAYSEHMSELDQNFTVWCLNFTLTSIWTLKRTHHIYESSRNFVEFCEHLKPKSLNPEVVTNLIKGCLESLDKLSPDIGMNVFKGLSFIIAMQEDQSFQTNILQTILGVIGKRIHVLTNPTSQNVPHLINHLGLVKSLLYAFDGVKPQIPLTNILLQFYPLLETIFKNYKTQEDVIAETCNLEISMIMSIGSRKESFEIFNKMLSLSFSFFEYYQYASVLKLINSLMGNEKNILSQNNFTMICSKVFGSKDLLGNSDLLGVFFKFMCVVVDVSPNYLKSDLTEKIFDLGVFCVDYQGTSDFEVCLTVVKFFKKILTCTSFEKDVFSQMVLSFSGN